MIVDTSAIMAVALKEPEKDAILSTMAEADQLTMSAGTWIELQAVLTRRGNPALERVVERLFAEFGIVIASVNLAQAVTARGAYREFGRGTKHPANLNFGDCFAYALAKETGQPLLFKGDDFTQTDVVSAIQTSEGGKA